MSGPNDPRFDAEPNLYIDFQDAADRRFEVEMDRDFEMTYQDQLSMEIRRTNDLDAIEQRYKADKATLDANIVPAPRLDMEGQEQRDLRAEFDVIYYDYVSGIEATENYYGPMRDSIRDNGVPLNDVFEIEVDPILNDVAIPPTPILSDDLSAETDLVTLGVDIEYEFNSAVDSDYYGSGVSYDYDDMADPFAADYNSYDDSYDDEPALTDNDYNGGHDDGHDGGNGR